MIYYDTATKTMTGTESATTVPADDIRVAEFFKHLPDGKMLDFDTDGLPLIIDIPAPTSAELLTQAKEAKLIQIEDDYVLAENKPILIGTVLYQGGIESALSIDSYVRLNRLAGNTIHSIWDVSGTEYSHSDSEADAVILAIGSQASINKFTKKNRKVALESATTIEEVEAV